MTPDCGRTERVHLLVDGELLGAEADEVRGHLGECTICQRELGDVLQLEALAGIQKPVAQPARTNGLSVVSLSAVREARKPRRWAGWAAASGLAAAAALTLMVRSGDSDPYGLGESRPVEARLSHAGASEYRPYDVMRAGGAHDVQVPLSTLAKLEKDGDAQGLATGYLLRGERAQALVALSKAAPSAEVESDRAVAMLLSGDAEGALALVDSALRRVPLHPQALWNRGLALRELGLPLAAAEAFAQVAARGEPGWSREAAERAAALRQQLREREADWNAANAAGRELMANGALPSEAMVRRHPGLFRLYLYDAVRVAPDAARVHSFQRLAEQLDQHSGGQVLAQHLERLAKSDFAARAPLVPGYSKLAARTIDAAGIAELLARSEKAGQPDLRLGILLLARAVRPHLEEYERLAQESHDPWFRAVAAQERADALIATRPLEAERILRRGLQEAQAARIDYRAVPLQLKLGDLLASMHRVPEAFGADLAAYQKARTNEEWGQELNGLYQLATAARLRWTFALSRAFLGEALLRLPGDCSTQAFVHETAANLALFELRPQEARREFDAAPSCGGQMTLQAAMVLADLARLDGRPDDGRRLTEALKAMREAGGLTPGERAAVDHIEGRLLIEREPAAGRALLEKAIAQADALGRDDLSAQKARSYSYVTLELDEARAGRFDAVLARMAKELRHESAPGACTLGVGVDDERAFIALIGSDGKALGTYDGKRSEPLDRFVPKLSAAQVQALRACPVVRVLARPPLQGRAGILPPELAWAYGLEGKTRATAPIRPTRLVVSDVEPPTELGLPRLRTWATQGAGAHVELRGPAATPSRVLAEMQHADEIELHAHGLVDLALSDASLLALSPDADGAWALSAAQVRAQKLRARPLVLLAACRAAVGAPSLHAPWSLPAAFLEAGARAVLASPAEIPDAMARSFFDAVLAGIHAGKPEPVALRDARMSFRSRPGGAWVDTVVLFE